MKYQDGKPFVDKFDDLSQKVGGSSYFKHVTSKKDISEYLNDEAASEILKLTKKTVEELIRDGRLIVSKIFLYILREVLNAELWPIKEKIQSA